MDSESKISSAEQRAARRDLWETASAANDRPRQSQSEAMRDARRSVWEQASGRGGGSQEPRSNGGTGMERGLDYDPKVASLEAAVRALEAKIKFMEDDIPEPDGVAGEGGGCTEGDYAFKLSATENMDGNGDPYDPPMFTVSVLGGTAQTLGGTPYFYEDVEIPDAEDGDYIFLRYRNVDLSYVEVGDWDSDIHYGTASYIDSTYDGAPFDLIFVLGRVGSDYAGFVRQDHKGGIVMPAISNVVDIQTKLP